MSEELISMSEVLPASSQSWNRDGYRPTTPPAGTHIHKVELGSIRMNHPYEGHLFRIGSRKDALAIQRLRGFPPEGTPGRLAVQVDELRWSGAEPIAVTDVFLSPETGRLYILDAETAGIHLFRIPPVESSPSILERERTIRLVLPPRVSLTRDSRLTVVSQENERPEKRDPFFYLTAPSSHVILKVDAETGTATVALGTPGRPGNTLGGKRGSSVFLREPSAVFFDDLSGCLYWADPGNGAIFSAHDGTVALVASFPSNIKLISILVYRLKEHVDEPMILQKAEAAIAPDWEEADPALLFAADSLSCQIFKVRLHSRDRSPRALFDFASRGPAEPTTLERLMALPNGDLLVATNSDWVYYVRHNLQSSNARDRVFHNIS